MQAILLPVMGVALAAACGFRVFVPLLVASLAIHSGYVTVSPGFAWLGSDAALIVLGIATVLEIGAYYVPWLDNMLDTITTPAAVIAGTLLAASFLTVTDPMFKWVLATIVGGGAAAAVQATTVAVRAASTGTTGGIANPIVSTVENIFSTALSIGHLR